jgi:hypothetical protein
MLPFNVVVSEPGTMDSTLLTGSASRHDGIITA